jgi:hypothetical protein
MLTAAAYKQHTHSTRLTLQPRKRNFVHSLSSISQQKLQCNYHAASCAATAATVEAAAVPAAAPAVVCWPCAVANVLLGQELQYLQQCSTVDSSTVEQ